MAWWPELAPSDQVHLLSSASIVQLAEYPVNFNKFSMHEANVAGGDKTVIRYRTFDNRSTETIRLTVKPDRVLVNEKSVPETDRTDTDGWSWNPLKSGGVLTVRHQTGNNISVTVK